MSKPDDMNWNEYVYSSEATHSETKNRRDRYLQAMATEARKILANSRIDKSRYVVETGTQVTIRSTDDWEMDDQEDARQLCDKLREANVGDESVTAVVKPQDSDVKLEGSNQHPFIDEYYVCVSMREVLSSIEEATKMATDQVNSLAEDKLE